MTYFRDVYKKRGNWWGATSKEQYLNVAKKYFEDYLLNSPTADTITLNNIEVMAGVQENKDDPNKITKYFLIGLDTEVNPGQLIYWYNDYWLVLQKEKRSFEAYNKVLAVRCNHNIKWIDSYGVLNETPAYLFGGMDNRVEDNFRIASGLMVMPQANKNIEIILPYMPIQSEQRFIIRNEAWRVLERDLVSVNGILYMYLIEDLVDSFTDNTTDSIADYDRIDSSTIDLGLTILNLAVGESFSFNPVLYKSGKAIAGAQFTYSSVGANIYFSISSNTILGLTFGSATIIVSSVDQPDLQATCTVNVLASGTPVVILQLVGDESIKWGRTRTYTALYNDGGVPSEVAATFTLINNESNLVSFVSQDSTSCSIIGNVDNLSGTVILRATTAYGTVDKTISVVSVW